MLIGLFVGGGGGGVVVIVLAAGDVGVIVEHHLEKVCNCASNETVNRNSALRHAYNS